ncbi:MAG: YraN family protein [Candidatus Poribacteria bacterium]|nr:YraN family protein [Candidatus Poribacteria bacterium]MDE0504962.1 YraN family protein [Candidatus Poribacteria bacterium]
MSQSKEVARIGEELAAEYLKERGYQILEQNYRLRTGEIDLIAKEGDRIVFVEVKTRRTLRFGVPQAAVTPAKQKQISKIALSYLQTHDMLDVPCRFDVVAILLSSNKSTPPKLEHIHNAFEFVAEE